MDRPKAAEGDELHRYITPVYSLKDGYHPTYFDTE